MWSYRNREFTDADIPDGAIGFIYEMKAWIDGREVKYIGKKNFYSDVKTPLGKKMLPTDKRLKTYTRKRKFTYRNYFSSNDELKLARKNGIAISREILEICFSKMELTYKECKYQFIYEVLEREEYLNKNILGKFYKFNTDNQ